MGLNRPKGTSQLNGVTNNIPQLLIGLSFPSFRNVSRHHWSLFNGWGKTKWKRIYLEALYSGVDGVRAFIADSCQAVFQGTYGVHTYHWTWTKRSVKMDLHRGACMMNHGTYSVVYGLPFISPKSMDTYTRCTTGVLLDTHPARNIPREPVSCNLRAGT